jgi:outer membrane protein TolC
MDCAFSQRKIWGWFCLLAILAGCARFQPQPLSPQKSAAQFDGRRLDDAGLRNFMAQNDFTSTNWPIQTWDLNSLTLAAFYYHPDLAVARAQWQVALAGVTTAGARPNPSLSFTPGFDNQIPNNPSPWIIPVTFDLPIETAGKRGLRLAEAERAAEAARLGFVSAAWQIRGGVRASLLECRQAGRRADLLEQQLAAQTNLLRLLRGRFEAGAATKSELTLMEIAGQKTQLDLCDARARQADARSRLAEALGVGLAALEGANLGFDFPADAPAALTALAARGVALRERADIRGALANYAAAEADLRLQLAKQYPDLHLGPGYAWNTGSAGDNQWSLGLTLELPLLDQNQGPIAEAEAQRKLAAAKFLALQAQVEGQIDRALAAVKVAREQLQTSAKLSAAEQRQEQSVEDQFQAGAGDRVDLLNARLEAASAAITALDNEERMESAVGALEDALQQPADSLAAVIQKLTAKM